MIRQCRRCQCVRVNLGGRIVHEGPPVLGPLQGIGWLEVPTPRHPLPIGIQFTFCPKCEAEVEAARKADEARRKAALAVRLPEVTAEDAEAADRARAIEFQDAAHAGT